MKRSPEVLLIDCFDSFTYNLADYLVRSGAKVKVVRIDEIYNPIEQICGYEGVVLSPGPGEPKDYPTIKKIIHSCINEKIPLLGICLGMQCIGEYFGLRIQKAVKAIHGKVRKVRKVNDDRLFHKIPEQFLVTRYHSLVLSKNNNKNIIPLLLSEEEYYMAIKINESNIYGVQYHPEAWLTEYGLTLLKNWCHIIKL